MENTWICTDPDNWQYGRKLEDGKFQFKEFDRNDYDKAEFDVDQLFDDPEYWIELTITLKEYPKEEILNHISAYYSSLNEINELYQDDAEWIIAECVFEQESGLY